MLQLSNALRTCIDEQGHLLVNHLECKPHIDRVEELAKAMLGCTLHVRGKSYIIRMLEIYYGGLADDAHDWFRTRFVYKTSKNREHTHIQSKEGFSVYLSSLNQNDTYARFDIVVGPEGVPVSFLVRSLWNEQFQIIGAKAGSPNVVLRQLNMQPEDHGSYIQTGPPASPATISIEDTHDHIISSRNLKITQRKRINLNSTFESLHEINWNFVLE